MATVGLAISPATPTPARSHEHESPGAGDAGILSSWEVGAEVGNVKNNRPELMERVGLL